MTTITCIHCHKQFSDVAIGTQHRNHCPHCLYSQHLDTHPGDRQATCSGAMQPIGLTFKSEGGKKTGELMLVHQCQKCGTISKNRIAGDDDPQAILDLFNQTKNNPQPKNIDFPLLTATDEREIITQLFGKAYFENNN